VYLEKLVSLDLTNPELRVLRKALQHGEKNIRFWPKFRWVQLILALMAIAVSALGLWRMETIADVSSFSALGLEQSKLTELVDDLVERRTDNIRAELRLHIGVVISGSVGLLLLVFTWVSWRGKAQDIALVINLRKLLTAYDDPDEST